MRSSQPHPRNGGQFAASTSWEELWDNPLLLQGRDPKLCLHRPNLSARRGFRNHPRQLKGRADLQLQDSVSKMNPRAGHRGPLGLVNRAVCSQSVLATQALANPRGTRLRAILRNVRTRPPHPLGATRPKGESHSALHSRIQLEPRMCRSRPRVWVSALLGDWQPQSPWPGVVEVSCYSYPGQHLAQAWYWSWTCGQGQQACW